MAMNQGRNPRSVKTMNQVWSKLMKYAEQDEWKTKAISNAFNDMLDDLLGDDFFGTEGQNDPRGDRRILIKDKRKCTCGPDHICDGNRGHYAADCPENCEIHGKHEHKWEFQYVSPTRGHVFMCVDCGKTEDDGDYSYW